MVKLEELEMKEEVTFSEIRGIEQQQKGKSEQG